MWLDTCMEKTWRIVKVTTETSNTSHHGFGDYVDTKLADVDTITAETRGQAQRIFKQRNKGQRVLFTGVGATHYCLAPNE